MTVTATDTRFGKLAAAKAEEKEAGRLRREGRDEEAIEAYDHARELYNESDFAYGDGDLAKEVMRAIERCNTIVRNIRYPKEKRTSAKTPRPHCLACNKPLPRFKFDDKTFTDDTPREWGAYGDNRFCTLTCGWKWACKHAPMPKLKTP